MCSCNKTTRIPYLHPHKYIFFALKIHLLPLILAFSVCQSLSCSLFSQTRLSVYSFSFLVLSLLRLSPIYSNLSISHINRQVVFSPSFSFASFSLLLFFSFLCLLNFFAMICCLSFSLCIRYNKLLAVITQSLGDLVKALKGLVVMSSELELMANSLFINAVPEIWKAKARICPPHPFSLCVVFSHSTFLSFDSLRHINQI